MLCHDQPFASLKPFSSTLLMITVAGITLAAIIRRSSHHSSDDRFIHFRVLRVIDFPNLHLAARIARLAAGYCLLAFIPQIITAQYHFESWDTDRGLPQNGIHSILQSHDGYIWLATLDGLVRFDGVRFTVFNVGNTRGINSNRFERLYESRDGNLWLTTADTWVIKYRDGAFTSYSVPGGDTRDYAATGIWEDPEGRIIISTLKGLARLENEKFVATTSSERTPCTTSFVSAFGLAWCHDDA